MADNNGKLTTPLFRLSFPQLWEPKAAPGSDKAKFGLTMLFPKDADLSAMKKLAFEAIAAKFGEDRKKWPGNLKTLNFQSLSTGGKDGWPFRDGDSQDYDGYEGMISITCRSDTRPIVVDRNRKPITDKEDIYPGCYGHAVITAYAWDHPVGGKGVSFGLLAFMKAKDGEPFTRRYSEDDFAGLNYDDVSDSAESYADLDIPF